MAKQYTTILSTITGTNTGTNLAGIPVGMRISNIEIREHDADSLDPELFFNKMKRPGPGGTLQYFIIAKNYEDLESIYEDLETEGKTPQNIGIELTRKVICTDRRLNSRVTAYFLTKKEADALANDPRIESVELHPMYHTVAESHSLVTQHAIFPKEKINPYYDVKDYYNYDYTVVIRNPESIRTPTEYKNWGLLRCTLGEQITNWGAWKPWWFGPYEPNYRIDTFGLTADDVNPFAEGDVTLTQTGKNVDIVNIDDLEIDWTHPEFNSQADGNGTNRLRYYNWAIHDREVLSSTYNTSTFNVGFDLTQNGSVQFDGRASESCLYLSHPTAFDQDASSWTVEFWCLPDIMPSNPEYVNIYNPVNANGSNTGLLAIQLNNNQNGFTCTGYISVIDQNGSTILNSSIYEMYYARLWYHVALVKSSNSITLYVNGNNLASATYTNWKNTAVGAYIGRTYGGGLQTNYYRGIISNFRIVKGVAIYNSPVFFNPWSISPLSNTQTNNTTVPYNAITSTTATQFLSLNGRNIVDQSYNKIPITIIGDPKVVAFAPNYWHWNFGTVNNYPLPYNTGWYSDQPWVALNRLVQNGEHPTHVTGLAAGNTQGWARDSNLYHLTFADHPNIYPVGRGMNCFNYVKEFHKNKPINPATGRKNPTIMTNSWGRSISSQSYWWDAYAIEGLRFTEVGQSTLNSVKYSGSTATQAVSIPSNTSTNLSTGDFTIEGWIYPTTVTAANQGIISKGATSLLTGWEIRLSLNKIVAYWDNNLMSGFTSLSANKWYHFSLVRKGRAIGNYKLFLNGRLEATSSIAVTTDFSTTSSLYIGNSRSLNLPFNGNIAEVRIVKNLALYTPKLILGSRPIDDDAVARPPKIRISTSTSEPLGISVSSMPLTSNTTTIFLALTNGQTSSAWANYSTRQLTVVSTLNTITNTTHNLLDTFDANYLKFNGTNQYLSTSGTDFMFGDSAFTMECWIYPTTSNVIRGIACTWQSGGAWEWTIQADNTIQFMYTKISSGSASQTYKGATTILPDVWTHVTVMRIGNFLTFYINGITDAGGEYDISSASTMYWYNGSTKDLRIGVGADLSNYFKGNITNFRIIKGTSAYGDWFIPCSNILSIIDDTNTKLILNSANSAMYLKDTSQYNRTVTNNNGITFTSSGTYYAVAFDGNTYLQGAGLYIPNISVEQNLTIEAWIYPSITNTEMGIVNNWSIGGQFIFKINAFNSLEFIWTWSDAGYDWTFTSDKKIIPNTWQHVALVKDGAKKSASFYIDGIIDTTGIYDLGMLGNFYYYNNELKDLYIGVGADQSNYFVGKMSNLRINRSIPNYVYPSLVTHKNSVFKDYSSNNAVLTTSSGITISEDNPFDIITYDAYNRMYNDLAGAYTSMTPFFYSDLNYSATEHVLQFGAFFQYCGRAYHYTVAKFGYREYATGGNGPMYAPGGIYLDFAYADGRIAVKGRSYYLDNGATSTVTPTVGTNNDGYWEIPLPFNVHFGTTTQENLDQGLFGNSYNIYNKLYIGTHGYITFDAGSTTSTNFSSTNPAGQKIFINPGTHTIQRIYYLHETNQRAYLINNEDPFNMARNNYSSDDTLDLFRIRVEATANSTTGQLGKPTLEYELVFYSPSIDGDGNYKTILAIAIGRNDALRSVGQQSFGKSRNGDPFLKFQGTSMPARSEALIAELTDLIKEPGVIHTGSAGNSAWRIALPSERAWNDYILAQQIGSARLYFHRGSSPNVPDACDGSAIVVGSVDNIYQDRRAAYSNYGTGVTIYAPGTLTMSSIGPDSIAEAESMQPLDPRQKINLKPTPSTTGTLSENYYNSSIRNSNLQGSNSYYYNMQMSGTSMASPQVAGVLACALEIYPDMTQKQAKAYIQGTAKRDQLTENPEYHGQDYNTKNWASLGGGQNLYLYYKKERAVDGVAYPKLDVREKPTSGTVYPRRRKIK